MEWLQRKHYSCPVCRADAADIRDDAVTSLANFSSSMMIAPLLFVSVAATLMLVTILGGEKSFSPISENNHIFVKLLISLIIVCLGGCLFVRRYFNTIQENIYSEEFTELLGRIPISF